MVDITNRIYLEGFGRGYPSRKYGQLFLLEFPSDPRRKNGTFQMWSYYTSLESIFDADQNLIKKQGPEINV